MSHGFEDYFGSDDPKILKELLSKAEQRAEYYRKRCVEIRERTIDDMIRERISELVNQDPRLDQIEREIKKLDSEALALDEDQDQARRERQQIRADIDRLATIVQERIQ
jgi:hypothetical protein